jgi:aspartate-semialdehyde dehydrogenase
MTAAKQNEAIEAALIREQAYIDGAWCGADAGDTLAVTNPADGATIAQVPAMGAAETERAIEAAVAAFGGWRGQLARERARVLQAWFAEIQQHREALARLMTLEQGKPLHEARGEIDYAASFIEWFAEQARRIEGETIPSHLPGRHLMTRREPIGVVAVVTPWNFPAAMITRKAAAALAAGCPVVVRPASETPLTALAFTQLAERAGFPAGTLSVVTGPARPIVGAFMADARVRGLSFTGSTEVGRQLLAQGGATIKRMSMELGGHAPFIVFDDIDPDAAAEAALAAKFQTSGQDCLAANRIYVHQRIYEQFLQRFAARVETLRVGAGPEEGTDIGPLMNRQAVDKCQAHVDDALAHGARLLVGGQGHERGGLFYKPTVVADVDASMRICSEETFGPVAAVAPFSDEQDVVARANDTELGLVAYLYTQHHSRIMRLLPRLEYGMVAVNGVKITGAPAPFGGVKQSGLGREGGQVGIDEFTQLQYVCMAVDEPDNAARGVV